MYWVSKSGAQLSALFGQLWLKQLLWSCLFAWERRWMCVISLPRHISIIFLSLFFPVLLVCLCFVWFFNETANHLGPTMQTASEGRGFWAWKDWRDWVFYWVFIWNPKTPRSTWNVKALKITVLGLHKGKAVREPIKQVTKLNLWDVGRKCGRLEGWRNYSRSEFQEEQVNAWQTWEEYCPSPWDSSALPILWFCPSASPGINGQIVCAANRSQSCEALSGISYQFCQKCLPKSLCNCFHSCVFIMGSLIILHVVYETIPVIFRSGLSMLTSVLEGYIHHHSVVSEFHLGRVLPSWAGWPFPQQSQ